jgi:4-amino-4-deoxy-L-arabinose transferase-like glycosyltransferase
METIYRLRKVASSDLAVLVLCGAAVVFLHTVTNGRYGFHRDELATLDDAHSLAWGYVAYPPVTPFLARVALSLFGPSLTGLRFFAALAQGVVLVLTGLMTRHLGGGRQAQIVAALAAAIGGVAFSAGALFQYVTFDYLFWVAAAYFVVRLLASENARWCLALGAVIGVGMLTKYTMAFLVVGIAAGFLFTPARRYLWSPWLWCGIAVALIIVLPNLLWQIRHHFVTLDFLSYIHARDVRMGRTDNFVIDQFWVATSPATVPLWLAGLLYLFFTQEGKRYRTIGWMFIVPFVLFVIARGRAYYMAPGYPALMAAGTAWGERWVGSSSLPRARVIRRTTRSVLIVGGLVVAALVLPIAPPGSFWWQLADKAIGGNFNEQIGWPELVQTVAGIRDGLPIEDKSRLGILVGDSGMAGAINLYGPALGLPRAICGMNSHWFRGYGNPPPETVIVVGMTRVFAESAFESCEIAGHVTNRFGVHNSSIRNTEIFVCHGLREPWSSFWQALRSFG